MTKKTNTHLLLDDLPRGVRTKGLDEHRTPRAAWVNPQNVLKSKVLQYNPEKILLGSINGALIGIEDDRHIITVAGSRSGKGISSIIPNLLNYKGSMLVIDPKVRMRL